LFRNCLNVDDKSNVFTGAIFNLIERYVPKVHASAATKPATKRNKYASAIRSLMTRKRCLWRSYRATGSAATRANYDNVAKECRAKIYEYEKGSLIQLI